MVSLLRRPIGFAVLYAILAALVSYFTVNMDLSVNALVAINYGSLVLFTIVYVLLVVAHLSHAFRLRASIYIPILSLLIGLGLAVVVNPIIFIGLLKDINTWINLAISFVASYVLITIGNWLASFVFKSKGHI
jgi:hypothetical protein